MEIKITDFGLATTMKNNQGDLTTFCGTPNYISPEVAARKPYGPATDFWALGCLLITFMSGAPPKDAEITSDKSFWLSLLNRNSKEVVDLARRLLIRDPSKRLSASQYFSHPFFNPIHESKPLKSLHEYEEYLFAKAARLNHGNSSSKHVPSTLKDHDIVRKNSTTVKMHTNPKMENQPHNKNSSNDHLKSLVSSAMLNVLGYSESKNNSNKPILNKIEHVSSKSQDINNDNRNTLDLTLDTTRLNPMKQKTKHASIEILSDSNILASFFNDSFLMLLDLPSKSIFFFNNGTTIFNQSAAIDVVSFASLRKSKDNILRKMKYISKLIELIRAKTPKITLQTSQGKAKLMENGPNADLVVRFFNDIYVLHSRLKGIMEVRIPSKSDLPGSIQRFQLNKESSEINNHSFGIKLNTVPSTLKPVVSHIKLCYDLCLAADNLALEWESGVDPRAKNYTGNITYPLSISEDIDFSVFVPPGVSKKVLLLSKDVVDLKKRSFNNSYKNSFHLQNRGNELLPSKNLQKTSSTTSTLQHTASKENLRFSKDFRNNYERNVAESHKKPYYLNMMEDALGFKRSQDLNRGRNDFLSRDEYIGYLNDKPKTSLNQINYDSSKTDLTKNQIPYDNIKFGYIHGVGWCTCSKIGDIENEQHVFNLLFLDGSRMTVDSLADYVIYWNHRDEIAQSGSSMLPIDHTMPQTIKDKLKKLPDFLPQLGFEAD
ncbi:hypothetical protein BB560_007013 [Smittium megazygosporum]|uniref:Uncharacterized protein n=1 Tax=Smittium megazygosporum TaxID=133381 RepID=A0A2T9XZD6_9FUNG|nr:hypothetical protein BB560_007013 [Smittium megazygosporum]